MYRGKERPGESLLFCGVVIVTLSTDACGKASPFCHVAGHVMYRSKDRPSKSLYLKGVAGQVMHRGRQRLG